MYVFIDENFLKQLAVGLNTLQEPLNLKEKVQYDIAAIQDKFGIEAKDEDWIPEAGKMGSIIITQYLRIQSTRHQRDLYHKHGLGIFFFKPPSKTGYQYWEMVKQIIKHRESIKDLTRKSKIPFAYRCISKSNFEKLE